MGQISISSRIKIWLKVLSAYLQTFRGVKCSIYDSEETVAAILNGKSLIRFGDGEFGIYQGADIHYQPWSDNLKKEFEAIKTDFETGGKHCQYLLAVPKKYMQCSGIELGRKRVLVSSWAESRLYFKKNFNLNMRYGDSFLFEKKNKQIYSQIWNQLGDLREIIFVHNNAKYAKHFSLTYNRSVIYVPCPAYDAFSKVDQIMSDIILEINTRCLTRADVQIVLSAGPAGKVMAYHLSKAGYHCIDAGHCWDDPLES